MSRLTCRDRGSVNLPPLEPRIKNIQSPDGLVSQILRGQRPLLDSDHALLTAEIVELEQQQSLYAAQLKEIQSRRRAVRKALESRKSVYAPIRRLPRELLIEIFHSVCDSWWQEENRSWNLRLSPHSLDLSGPLWVLGRVCGFWRDTLHSSPASWARKLVVRQPFSEYDLEILQTYLERTGEHLLNLQVICSHWTEEEDMDDILSLLVQSCRRWKNLHISAFKQHMHHLESISQLPALQTIDMNIFGDYDCSGMCLSAPQLWKASIRVHGNPQIKLLPGITHFSGCIACPEDLRLLSQLPNLRRCSLWMKLAAKEAPVVTVAHLTHLHVDHTDVLDVLSAPLLGTLAIRLMTTLQGPRSSSAPESLTRFLHRSKCHLDSLSVSEAMFTLNTPSRMSALEACSTIPRLKLGLHSRMDSDIVEALTSPSVLPNLRHLILCMSLPSRDEWTTILRMARSRRDAGMLKLVEVQFELDEHDYHIAEDMRALTGDDFEMRVAKWDPPCRDPLSLEHLS